MATVATNFLPRSIHTPCLAGGSVSPTVTTLPMTCSPAATTRATPNRLAFSISHRMWCKSCNRFRRSGSARSVSARIASIHPERHRAVRQGRHRSKRVGWSAPRLRPQVSRVGQERRGQRWSAYRLPSSKRYLVQRLTSTKARLISRIGCAPCREARPRPASPPCRGARPRRSAE